MTPKEPRPGWLKSRGYLHITPKIDALKEEEEVVSKVSNKAFVRKHAFFPLIHSVIKERKYKVIPDAAGVRAHSYRSNDKFEKTAKNRPLHYATHIDSMIFGYYAQLLLARYEAELGKYPGLSDCVIAYRKIENDELADTGKSTINFAHEAFEQIKKRAADNDCVVLMFDIKSFFSELDHQKLKKAWSDLFNVERLEPDHFNVFNAATNFSYILRDDLRLPGKHSGKRKGFDERKLAAIRKTGGFEAFFASVEEFREAIRRKEIKIFKHPFVKAKRPVGIPQGLPISAVLANLYLLSFDLQVLNKVVNELGGYYRRYSDDIMVICRKDQYQETEQFILTSILDSKVEISKHKTEIFLFRRFSFSPQKNRLTAIQIVKDKAGNEAVYRIGEKPLTYLGFEFNGDKTLIKSANQAKFYRRMIYATKRKTHKAFIIARNNQLPRPVVFKGQLKKLYSILKLSATKEFSKRRKLVRNNWGEYSLKVYTKTNNKKRSNYFSYVDRASHITGNPEISNRVSHHHATVFNAALARRLNKF
jgi:hypothetical protein